MFCRYCGAAIPEDSVFCSKCGKRIVRTASPRVEKWVSTLRLKTPYPYFGLLLIAFIVWALGPDKPVVDFTDLKWSIELDQKLDTPTKNLYQQSLSIVIENTGAALKQEIPVEIQARIEPEQTAEVVAGFLGRELVIMEGGKPLPLVVVLADAIAPGDKRRYVLEGSIHAQAPFRVTYELHKEGADDLLASYTIEP